MNVAVITLDSLRYDTTQIANTPNFKNTFEKHSNEKNWIRVFSHGTYTLPSHMTMLHKGHFPGDPKLPFPYDCGEGGKSIFRNDLPYIREKPSLFKLPDAENIVKGFSKNNYRTIGIGGVGWFNTNVQTSNFWGNRYFEEFYWDHSFHEDNPNSLQYQIELSKKLLANKQDKNIFYFLNISSTHAPYRNNGYSVEGQAKALEYVDSKIVELLELLPRPCFTIICADHGDCFGEDGYYGHAIYHQKVLEVPMNVFIME